QHSGLEPHNIIKCILHNEQYITLISTVVTACKQRSTLGFGNLKFPFSLKVLINYLADRSNEKEKCGLSGVKKPVRKYIPAETEDTTAPKNEEEEEDDDDDDDAIDLFESNTEEECEEAKKIKEEHLTQLEAKISRKPTLLTKSSIFFEMKPWDVEMGMANLSCGSSKLIPVGYRMKEPQIQCVL
uniref:Uncharacterized protein n=1 Tax=Erpetoichthys calabaricus TaxID=27687 RepID=A0A8C4T9M3_ERPCA